ncbi:MAG: adenylate/guanylate cyclase protein [Ilumatobacteraceae bacterium]|nr:adenylate/guanylate cyclase protein [Ilumatobacteraceae bacterium]
MDPDIRYARASDGLNIAYWSMGTGMTMILLPPTAAHRIQYELQVSGLRAMASASARVLRFVRYDPRGIGLSDTPEGVVSVDALVLDLEAVANATSPDEPIAISAPGRFGPVAIAFAARFPERVAKLILWATASAGNAMQTEPLRTLTQMATVDWDLAMESMVHAVDSYEDAPGASEFGRLARDLPPAARESFLRFEEDGFGWDVTALLEHVRCPTLVMHPERNRYLPPENARFLASRIPHATLRMIDTASAHAGHPDVLRVGGEFLFGGSSFAGAADRGRTTVVVLIVDIVNSTGLIEQLGDERYRRDALALDGELRTIIASCQGRTVDGTNLGDGVLATFVSAQQAIAAARQCAEAARARDLPVHLGLHAGDVIRRADTIYGGAVNIAARLSGLSAPSEILLSSTIRDLARTSATDVMFVDRGMHDLKGIAEPVHVFAIAAPPSA